MCSSTPKARHLKSYPHYFSKKSMNTTYPQKLWIKLSTFPQRIHLDIQPQDLSTSGVDNLSTFPQCKTGQRAFLVHWFLSPRLSTDNVDNLSTLSVDNLGMKSVISYLSGIKLRWSIYDSDTMGLIDRCSKSTDFGYIYLWERYYHYHR